MLTGLEQEEKMKKSSKDISINVLLFLPILFMLSCSSTQFITDDESSYNELKRKVSNREATVRLRNGIEMKSHNIVVDTDTTYVGETKIATINLDKITIVDHDKGAVTGIAVGLGIGGLIGAISFTAAYGESIYDDNAMEAMGLAIVAPIAGFLIGGSVGAINGNTNTFIFPEIQSLNAQATDFIKSTEFKVIEIDAIIERSLDYTILLWQGKKIRLLNTQFILIETEKAIYVRVPKEIFLKKFK
jgi:hypothetical protein